MIIAEGGNVFKNAEGQPLTQRINQADVPATVKWLERLTGLDLSGPKDPESGYPTRWLGSTGKKDTSGDLDFAVLSADAPRAQLIELLANWLRKSGVPEEQIFNSGKNKNDGWIKDAGELHFRTPIRGNPELGYVQADFNFYDTPKQFNWGLFYSSGTSPGYKGVYRNVLLSSIAKARGLKVGGNGVIDRATNQVISTNPNQLAQAVLGPGHTARDLATVESIYAALAGDPQRDAKLADFRGYLQQQGMPEPDIVRENDVNFLARLRDRIVNQGMVPLIEHEIITEGKDPRIPYVEDLVFKSGLRGVKQAMDIIQQSAENTKQYVTIKWDGSPALIFGRKPTGEFVLTDKAGATAVGYDGLATSPKQIADIMAQRDRDAAAKGNKADRGQTLTPMYRDIWPYFEKAVPEDFRGYLKGDLLYYPTMPYVERTGAYHFQPNRTPGGIPYAIPVASPLGQQIKDTKVGIVVHSQMPDPAAPEQPVQTSLDQLLNPVAGLMVTRPVVDNIQNLVPNSNIVKQLKALANSQPGQAINSLLNPTDLRALQITDLPALMESFINSLKGTDFSDATPNGFLSWLEGKVTPRKFNNIYSHLVSPKSNAAGLAAAFTAWNLLEQLRDDLNRQLDLQQPGQEGWVMATPAGRAKLVSRRAGGFGARGTQPQTT
jgi:hypothetical protein